LHDLTNLSAFILFLSPILINSNIVYA